MVANGLPITFPSAAVALQPGLKFRHALRVDEDGCFELVGLGPEWVELRGGQLSASDAGPDRCATQPQFRNGFLQLRSRKIRMLQ